MIILGIDPGYERLGVAILEKTENKEVLLFSDCIKTSAKLPFSDRLISLGDSVTNLIEGYKPNVLAIEKLYFHNNQKTAMYVSQVMGAIIYISKNKNMQIEEYTPLQIKSAITGNGKANKQQIMSMLHHLVRINKKIKYDDEYDAIATCLTCSAYHKGHN